jgi:signal transduction histidine kinase
VTRRPPPSLLLDVVLVVAVWGFGTWATAVRGGQDTWLVQSWTAWVWVAVAHLPLLLRRQAPVAGFWAAYTLTGGALVAGVDGAFILFVPAAALYALARRRPRAYLWPACLVIAGPWVAIWLADGRLWGDVVAMATTLAAVTLLGLNLRTRAAYLAELEDRARRLERERDQQAQLAAAGERARIAREMHDIVAHNLTVMVALADGASLAAERAPEQASAAMAEVSRTGRQALSDMRRLLGVMRDGPDAGTAGHRPLPGLGELDGLVEQVRRAGLRVHLTRQGTPARCGPATGLTAYRVVQEGLTNTLKHAGPQARAEVRLCHDPGELALEVLDDGADRPAPAVTVEGHGLAGIRERVAAFGGSVESGPRPGGGWRLAARLPLPDDAPEPA